MSTVQEVTDPQGIDHAEDGKRLGRGTSSSQNPRRGLTRPTRVVVKKVTTTNSPQYWPGRSLSLKSCAVDNYTGPGSLQVVHEDAEDKSKAILYCQGSHQSLDVSLLLMGRLQDPAPKTWLKFNIPDKKPEISISESTRTIVFCVDGTRWQIVLDAGPKSVEDTKACIRRLENVLKEMPSDWLSYNNIARQSTFGAKFKDGALAEHFRGARTWVFKGHLASQEWVDFREGKNPPKPTRRVGKKAAKATEERTVRRSKRIAERSLALRSEAASGQTMMPPPKPAMRSVKQSKPTKKRKYAQESEPVTESVTNLADNGEIHVPMDVDESSKVEDNEDVPSDSDSKKKRPKLSHDQALRKASNAEASKPRARTFDNLRMVGIRRVDSSPTTWTVTCVDTRTDETRDFDSADLPMSLLLEYDDRY